MLRRILLLVMLGGLVPILLLALLVLMSHLLVMAASLEGPAGTKTLISSRRIFIGSYSVPVSRRLWPSLLVLGGAAALVIGGVYLLKDDPPGLPVAGSSEGRTGRD